MNRVILMGRLCDEPTTKYTEQGLCVARYRLAVNRRGEKNIADFIQIVAFGKSGEFAEKYLHKGTKIVLSGRIQTGSYTDKNGNKNYTTEVVAEDQEFAESKKSDESKEGEWEQITTEDLPFSQP